MLRLKNLANKYQKRLVRPLYANTQATPYSATLDASLRGDDGSLDLTSIGSPAASTFKLKGGLVPGTVVTRVKNSEGVLPSTGAEDGSEQPFGLLCNFVGGDLDEGFSGDSLQNSVGVWRGPDAVFEVLAPAFDDTTDNNALTITAAIAAADAPGASIWLFASTDGRLVADNGNGANAPSGYRAPVARLVEMPSSSRIVVDLVV